MDVVMWMILLGVAGFSAGALLALVVNGRERNG